MFVCVPLTLCVRLPPQMPVLVAWKTLIDNLFTYDKTLMADVLGTRVSHKSMGKATDGRERRG